MKQISLALILFAAAVVAHGALPVSVAQEQARAADSFVRENARKRAQNPRALNFTIKLHDNRTKFHQGEIIRLELSFSSNAARTFILDNASYDRSGRLELDQFVLDHPEGTADPLFDYFNSGVFGFMGGGLRGMPELSDKPEVVYAELNEWMRFDKPGHYRLYVVSGRVSRKRSPEDPFGSSNAAAISNIVEFEIVAADEKWNSQQLNEANAILAKREGEHRGACRSLRFLGTKAAVDEMVKRFRGSDANCDSEYYFGLIGSPDRDFVIRIMGQAVSAQEQPVTSSFINLLALLTFVSKESAAAHYPQGDDEGIKQWQAQMEQRRHSYDQVVLNYLLELATAVPQKGEAARAVSLQTLIDFHKTLKTNDSEQLKSLIATVPEVFTRLPLDGQLRLLTYHWRVWAGNAMLPILRQIYEQPDNGKDSHQQGELRSIVLRRLYELAPEEGRGLILDDLRRAKPRTSIATLRSLPDQTLPELDEVLAANLEQSAEPNGHGNIEAISELVERYATDAIASRVRAVYEGPGAGRWACRIQAALLAYLTRVDPEGGGDLIDKALAARGKGFSRCYPSTLSDVARLHMSAQLQEAAFKALEEDDVEMVANAAGVLAQFGQAEAEDQLWRRLERWHEQAEPRAQALRKQNPGIPALGAPALSGEVAIEQALRTAISFGQAWLTGPEKLKRLRSLCVSDDCRKEVDNVDRTWDRKQEIHISPGYDLNHPYSFTLAQYQPTSIAALKQKLLQFPRGTTFIWHAAGNLDDDPAEPRLFSQVKALLEERGMKLERATGQVQ